MFTHFPKGTLPYLKRLQNNNNKEWFELHREDYEKFILEPCRDFVDEMGEHLQALVPTINAIPKINKSLFRIYRDVRFSKDKTPIKSRIGVLFWQGNDIRMQSSCFYLHFSPQEFLIAGGIRTFDPDLLSAYREYIKVPKHRDDLHQIIENLKEAGYTILEPGYKRIPPMFDKEISHSYLTRMKAVAVFYDLSPTLLNDDRLLIELYKHYEQFLPLQQWVYEMSLTK